MPGLIRPLAYLLPLTYFLELIRGIMIKGTGLVELWLPLAALVAFTLAFITACVYRFQKTLR